MSPLAPLAFTLAAMGAAGFAWLGLIIAWRWLRALMDDGDGQGGIPGHGHLRRVVADTDREHRPVTRTEQLPLADLVASPELERYAQWRAASPGLPAVPGAVAVCTRCARSRAGLPCTHLPCACRDDCYAAECCGGFE